MAFQRSRLPMVVAENLAYFGAKALILMLPSTLPTGSASAPMVQRAPPRWAGPKLLSAPPTKLRMRWGIQSLGASKYQAIWSDRINGTSAGQPIYQQKFNGNNAVGPASVLRADALNKVNNPSFARLNDGTGLLVTSCICFPIIYTGQKIDKTGKLSATATTLSQGGGDVTLNFGAVGGSSVLGAYLKNSTNLAIRVFSGALAPIGPLRNLPILTKPDEVESQRQIGTVGNKIYSLYETLSADKRRFDINGRHSGTNLTGSNKYKAFLKNTDWYGER